MIVFGGFWFVLAWCLVPYIIKGAKTVFICFYVFMLLALSVTYGLPILFALFPYAVALIAIIGFIMVIMVVRDMKKDKAVVNSDEYKKNIEQWNARKEIAKNKLLAAGEEVTDYKIVMGAYEVTEDEADKFMGKE